MNTNFRCELTVILFCVRGVRATMKEDDREKTGLPPVLVPEKKEHLKESAV